MSGPLIEAIALIDQAQELLSDADRIARACSSGKASLYIQGARGSLRLATEIAARRTSARWELAELGVSLVPDDPSRPIGRRMPLAEDSGVGIERDADFEQAPRPVHGCLGVDLFDCLRIRDLAARPVFATFLASGLGHHEWLSLRSGARWQPHAAAAATLVSVLGGGRPVSATPPSETGGLVDRMVVTELGALGWRLLGTPSI